MTIASFIEGIRLDIEQALQKNCPVDKGLLRSSINAMVSGNKIKIYMLEYGIWVDLGTPPHEITPKSKQALKWISKESGQVIYAKKVMHPGTDPNPFIRNTFYHEFPQIINKNAKMHLGVQNVEVSFT